MTALLLTIGIYSHIALFLIVASAKPSTVSGVARSIFTDIMFFLHLGAAIYFWVRFFGWPA